MNKIHGMGWIPDVVDERDYTEETPEVAEVLKTLTPEVEKQGCFSFFKATPPAEPVAGAVDLSAGFGPVLNQGEIGSCTAQAAAGIVQYTQHKAYGRSVNPSRLFVYKVTRKLDGLAGDSGGHLRTTMKALALLGAPPEKYFVYTDRPGWDNEPDAFLYALAQEYNALTYYRLDPVGRTTDEMLAAIKSNLDAGLPVMGGFIVYASIDDAANNGGYIHMPDASERELGGHAIVIVGYDDEKKLLKIRNSWGPLWGSAGYGYLPYDYVLKGLSWDFWSLVESGFVDMVQFD